MKRPERRKEKAYPVSRGAGAAQEPFEPAPQGPRRGGRAGAPSHGCGRRSAPRLNGSAAPRGSGTSPTSRASPLQLPQRPHRWTLRFLPRKRALYCSPRLSRGTRRAH